MSSFGFDTLGFLGGAMILGVGNFELEKLSAMDERPLPPVI